jgi:uncharacterized membrane protein
MVTHIFMPNKNLNQIFKWPIVIGLLTAYGLVAALIVDGGSWEHLAILALTVPVVVMLYFYWIKRE